MSCVTTYLVKLVSLFCVHRSSDSDFRKCELLSIIIVSIKRYERRNNLSCFGTNSAFSYQIMSKKNHNDKPNLNKSVNIQIIIYLRTEQNT